MSRLGKFVTAATAAIVVGVTAVFYAQPTLLERFEEKIYDLRARFVRPAASPSGKIVVVAIDEKSIAELGRFPWSRTAFAALVDRAADAGAAAVLIDVAFPEPESPPADEQFAAALRRFGRTTLSVAFTLAPRGDVAAVLHNIPVLRAVARREAHINLSPDEDGVVRWSRLVVDQDGTRTPSFGLAAAMEALGAQSVAVEPFAISVGGRVVPTDGRHRALIPYLGTAGVIPRHSFSDVVAGRVPPEQLRGRVLLVGATALGIYDMRVTPFSNNTPGVELHAHVAEGILRGDFTRRGGVEALADILAIALVGGAVSLAAVRLHASAAFPVAVALMMGYAVFAGAMFRWGMWVTVVYPLLSGILAYGSSSYLRFIFVDRRARTIRAMFSCYVSKKIVDQLVLHPELAHVGGESKVVTIVFSDLKNYTGFCEKRTPREVVAILNEYLAAMSTVIIEHDGTLDKFLGDGILAYWGAPVPQEDHAERAVRCVARMVERLEELQQQWRARGLEPLESGIGINSGEVVVGNLGAEGIKMEYTVIGDNVNLTYRIQNEGRATNRPAMSDATYALVRDIVDVEPIGPVTVKGKQNPVMLYALLGLKTRGGAAAGTTAEKPGP